MSSRRELIKSLAAFSAISLAPFSSSIAQPPSNRQDLPKPRIFPKCLMKGDLIGLVTPGGTIVEAQLNEAVEKLEGFGFRTYYKESVLSTYGYFAGSDQERADELMHMFNNEDVDAILCVRGGYGSIRVLDLLDFNQIQQNPKALIGYSDITALLTSIYKKTGLISFHGPLGVSSFNDFTYDSFKRVLMNPRNKYKYPYQREANTEDNVEYDIYTIQEGEAEGELIGGNISVLDSMIGSVYEPDFENKIVYLEEIGEQTYRVDKMLFHLLYATNIKRAAGIVMGVFDDCNVNKEEPKLSLKQAIDDLFRPLGIPVSYGLPFGHISTMITIPNGIRARMNATKNSLKLLEKAVS